MRNCRTPQGKLQCLIRLKEKIVECIDIKRREEEERQELLENN